MTADPRIFDFYHQMLHGPTKYEYARWEAHNLTLEQTFFDRRAGIEFAIDRQRIDNGFLSPFDYRITFDPNEVLPNGAPNPNFLRPLATSNGFKRVYSQDRDAFRVTGFHSLDLRRFRRGPTWLGRLLGRHLLNGNHSRSEAHYQQLGGYPYQTGSDWPAYNGQALPGLIGSGFRNVQVIRYLGPPVSRTSVLGDLRVQGLTVGQNPDASSFSMLSNRRPATTAPGGLQPWQPATFTLLTNGRENLDASNRTGQRFSDRTEQQAHSTAFALQSHWLDGTVVTTAGWRRDQVWNYDAGLAPTTATGHADLSWDGWPTRLQRELSQDTTNWGVVGHLPGFLRRFLPAGIEGGVTYNRASNFRVAPQRYTITNEALPAETGETKEYGVRLALFSGKLELRAVHYTSLADKATVTTFVQDGTKTDELRKWSFRGVTNYTFGSEEFGGRMKGLNLGGAVRWSAAPVLGHAGKTIVSGGQTLAVSDVTRPYLGEAETIFDVGIGYRRKLRNRIDWKVQLNVRNLGVGNELRPLAVLPDGRAVQFTIKEPQRWTVTNILSF